MVRVKSTNQRRIARTLALQSMFAVDIRANSDGPFFEWLDAEDEAPEGALAFATNLITGILDNCSGLDELIGRYAPAWPVSQLSLIDRNILRMALFELLYNPGTPRKTAINEAVELAKIFGSESSARFVNGVLGSVMAGLEFGALAPVEPVPEGR